MSLLPLLVFSQVRAAKANDRLVQAGHINRDVNASFAGKPDSCLADAQAKIDQLRAAGFDVSLMIVHKHGSPDTHAIVHLRLNDVTYYLNNTNNTLATEWSSLYDVVQVRD